MNLSDARTKALSERKDGKIRLTMESPKYFIFEMVPKTAKDSDQYEDSLVSVDKKTGKFDVYQPSEDWDDYDKAVIVD